MVSIMYKKENVYIYSNPLPVSLDLKKVLTEKLQKAGFNVIPELQKDTSLIFCIGGDGTLLHLVHELNFPTAPIAGINTGHLGFFQDTSPEKIDEMIENYKQGNFYIQNLRTLKATIQHDGQISKWYGMNEMIVKGNVGCTVHLSISIGQNFIEHFSGDGILLSTPAGSTAYNYSLGGGLVDPSLEVLQVTPIAPMNTNAYRSFTSSLLLPADKYLFIRPERKDAHIRMQADGFTREYFHVDTIMIDYSSMTLHMLKSRDFDFWKKVKEKFLGNDNATYSENEER